MHNNSNRMNRVPRMMGGMQEKAQRILGGQLKDFLAN